MPERKIAILPFFCLGLFLILFSAAKKPLIQEAARVLVDPVNVPSPPAYAVGLPSRDPNLDVQPGFQSPPKGYGEVAFFWWLGDPLTRERLTWQLDQLSGKGIMGLQINYAHTDRGGVSYGLSMPSEPPLFSPAWWDLVRWFAGEAKKRGMSISLSDYTLGLGQGWAMDAAVAEQPDLSGWELRHEWKDVTGGQDCDWNLPEGWVSLMAYRWAGDKAEPGSAADLRGRVVAGRLRWRPPEGDWRLVAVFAKQVRPSLDPTHPDSGPAYIKHFFEPFEKHLPGECGRALNFFFSDEMDFRLHGPIWNARLAAEFKKRKGYDIVPELPALFMNTGPRTSKVRLDYSDVRVALSEEAFFRPVFEWHQRRGMIYGCDHGGRGKDVTEFGDYFRTQRWNQGPGCDQPKLDKDLIKSKVASSIAHLYLRPRVWIEGYHSSGWGTTSAGLVDATFANFLMGHNLLSLHGLYYSTHGGWWEWAPPCNHWRMPYWRQMGPFMDAAERLSYLFSQGYHVCDVAIMYPVAPVEAGMDGRQAVETAFDTGRSLYGATIDFDFIDFESVVRAKSRDGRLKVSGEAYRVLILPAMRAVRHAAMEKVAEFVGQGGIVIAVGALPEASDRTGLGDPELERLIKKVFGLSAREAAELKKPSVFRSEGAGLAAVIQKSEEVAAFIRQNVAPDLDIGGAGKQEFFFLHRRAGPREIFALYGAPKNTESRFRATGRVELWDPWTGKILPVSVLEQTATETRLRLPLESEELQLIVFSPGRPEKDDGKPEPPPQTVAVEGPWACELAPTMDNQWGDFRWPPSLGLIGAEARRFKYSQENMTHPGWHVPNLDDSSWTKQSSSFGTMFWQLGPLPAELDSRELEASLAASKQMDPSVPIPIGSTEVKWKPYDFSWRWGVEGDAGHQGYHGLKENMYDEFIRLGKLVDHSTEAVREREAAGTRYFLWTTASASRRMTGRILCGGMKPAALWLNGRQVRNLDLAVDLNAGANPLLLRYDEPGVSWVLVTEPGFNIPEIIPGSLAMRWHGSKGILPFDVRPEEAEPAGWYRFKAPPGLKAMTVTVHGTIQAWVDGKAIQGLERPGTESGAKRYRFALAEAVKGDASVALRVAQERGLYGGAALPEPVAFECGAGTVLPGDWSRLEGLESYSGGMWYRKEILLPGIADKRRIILDLGDVSSSAEVRVNGQSAGVRVTPPWRWDVTKLVGPRENGFEVLVYNTLANHYMNIPTRYRGNPGSGLLGPVRVVIEK